MKTMRKNSVNHVRSVKSTIMRNKDKRREAVLEKNEDNVDVGGGIIPGDNNQETVLTDSSNEVSDHSNDLTDPDSGLRNRGQRMKE